MFSVSFSSVLAFEILPRGAGLHEIRVDSLSAKDQTVIDLDFIFLQMAWSLFHYPRISKHQVKDARATRLDVTINSRHRNLPVVELRHEDQQVQRRLVVMSSGLFASEWEDLHSAVLFFEKGYDVLKVPTGFSESFIEAFPWISSGDIDSEADILVQSVNAYRTKYGINPNDHTAVAFGSSYGASVVLKAAERHPQFFLKTIATGPVYDFSYAVKFFDSLMKADPPLQSSDQVQKGMRFLMALDPQTLASDEYEVFAKSKIAEALLKKVRLFCIVSSETTEDKNCVNLKSFVEIATHLKFKMPVGLLNASQDPSVFVLTTKNDPLNAQIVPIGKTVVLEKGGHFGFLETTVERSFIESALAE